MAEPRLPVLAILAILLAGFAVYPSPSTSLPTIPKVRAITVPIVLTGCSLITGGCIHGGWNGTTNSPNPSITVHQGDTVSVSLTSVDGNTHQFLVDVDRDGAANTNCPAVDPCSVFFSPSTPTSYSFSVSFAPATYTYFCTLHPTVMFASFVVLAAPPVGGAIVPADKPALLAPYIGLASFIIGAVAIAIVLQKRVSNVRKGK